MTELNFKRALEKRLRDSSVSVDDLIAPTARMVRSPGIPDLRIETITDEELREFGVELEGDKTVKRLRR